MVDRPPPSRLSVVERGGRLVVIDRESGRTPPTAAERMAAHDARMGHEAVRPVMPEPLAEAIVIPAPPPRTVAVPVAHPPRRAPDDAKTVQRRIAATLAERSRQSRGDETPRPAPDRPRAPPAPAPARVEQRPRPTEGGGDRKTIVTAKWWDAKGPRTIQLGPNGRAELSGGFMALLFMVIAIVVVTAFVSLPVLLVLGFLSLRFGGTVIGPIGASLIDKALAERG